jgi:hypothetical protein
MKKQLLLFIFLYLVAGKVSFQAQCSLDQVGTANFVATSLLSDMAVAPNGDVYTFAMNTSTGKFQLQKGKISNSFTIQATFTGSTSARPAIAINKGNGKVSVLIRDEPNGKVARLYYLSGSSLIQQGPDISSTQVTDLALAFNSLGEEYVMYTDLGNGNKATVKKWNGGGGTWDNVGTGVVSSGGAQFNSIVIDNNNIPLVAFQDAANGNKVNVMKYSGSWTSFGLFGTGTINNCKIKIGPLTNNYYLGYIETPGNAVIQKYDGIAWSQLGANVPSLSIQNNTFDLELDPVETPVITTILSTPPYPVAYKYDGSNWNSYISYINSSTAVSTSLDFDAAGYPYFFYVDQPGNNALNVKTQSSSIQITTQPASSTLCNGSPGNFICGTTGGSPTYQWQVSTGGGAFVNAGAPYTNVTTSNLQFTANPSLNQNNLRCIVNVGCKNLISNIATLTVSSPSISFTTNDPVCYNTCDGSISSIVSGGQAPYNYNWTGGYTTANITNQCAGIYSLTVIDAMSCAATNTVVLNSPAAISINFSGNQSICNGASTTLTATAIGPNAPFSYSWTPSTGLNNTNTSVVIANPTSSITYFVTATNTLGCARTETVMVNVNPAPTLTANPGTSTICNGSSATLGASGADTYTIFPGGLFGVPNNVSPSSTTTYSIVGTNTLTGCTNTVTSLVNVNPLPTANAGPDTDLTCSNTSVVLSGSSVGATTFNWTGPGVVSGGTTQAPTVNAVGNYTFYATSLAGCVNMDFVVVGQNTVAPTTSTNVSGVLSCIINTVNVSVTTTVSPVTYTWTGTGIVSAANISTITVNQAGVKNYTVTNTTNGCVKTGTLNVTQNLLAPSPTASSSGTVTCLSNTIQLSGTPPSGVTYTWTAPSGSSILSGTNSATANGNGAGTYTLTVRMISSGCMNSATVSAAQNTVAPTPTASNSGTLTCSNNTVALTATGGGTYLWSGTGIVSGGNTANPVVNSTGPYTVTVTAANGCTATANTSVTQNTVAPNPIASNSGPINCVTPTVNLTSNSIPGATYLWSGPSITGATTTQNTSANAQGTYSVLATTIVNGCTATATTNVNADIVAPTFTVSSSQNTICSGSSSTLSATSSNTNVTYNWQPGSINNSSITASPNVTTQYSATATNTINGCVTTNTIDLTVNATPTIAISGNLGICNGSSTTLTGNGATNYMWSTGDNTNTVTVTPTVTTTYTLNGDNGNGCNGTNTVTVSIVSNKSITGVVTSTGTPTNGDVTLYKYDSNLTLWDSITTVPFTSNYTFNNIDSALYVIRAIPTATNIQVTYADSSINWQNATIVTHGCTNNTTQNIKLVELQNFVAGPGILSGIVIEGNNFGQRTMNEGLKPTVPGNPIGGIIVKGGKNPGGQMFVQTTTAADGTYTLTGLPLNSGSDNYFIFIDIPGLDTNGTYYRAITSGNTNFQNLNFEVDDQYIYPTSVTSIIENSSLLNNTIELYPNPAKDNVTIRYSLKEETFVSISLFDVLGNEIKTTTISGIESASAHSHLINTTNLSNGVYFVKVKLNNSENTIKFIINQ